MAAAAMAAEAAAAAAHAQSAAGHAAERPNASLTAAERQQKRERKRALKQEHRTARAQRRAVTAASWAQQQQQQHSASRSAGPPLGEAAGDDAAAAATAAAAAAPQTVALKDDMGRVYAHAPAAIVGAARSRLGKFMQSYLDEPVYVAARAEHQAKALELLDKMKKGRQKVEDFGDPGALWGYAKYKWPARALLTFEAFRQAHCSGFLAAVPPELRAAGATAVAVGGGPGNDIFGFELCRQLVLSQPGASGGGGSQGGEGAAVGSVGRRIVFDFCAEAWAPLVTKAGALLGCPAECCGCDLSRPLTDSVNSRLRETAGSTAVFLFSYVLQEVGTLGCWRACLAGLWAAAPIGALFYVKDPNDRTAHQVLQLLGAGSAGWRPGVEYCWVCGALLLRKPLASAPGPGAIGGGATDAPE
jgi:hypothetical protein